MSSFTFTEVVRLAQIGTGGWGRNLLRTLAKLPSAELVVLCDRDEAALASASKQAPSARTTTHIETVLADSSVDAIVIAPGEPDSLTAACLEAGKHVFVEAPLASSAEAASELVSLASSNDLRLMTGHVLRYHPAVQSLREAIQNGELGEVRTLSWRLAGLRASDSVSVLEQLGPSALSVTRALVDADPRAVTAHGRSYTSEGADDVVLLTIEFAEGVLVHLHLSRIDAWKSRRLTVVGTRGAARFDDMDPTAPLQLISREEDMQDRTAPDYAQAVRARWGDVHSPRLPSVEPLVLECREFVASVREQRPPLTDGTDGLAVLKLMDAAKRSLSTSAVRIELA